MSTIEGDIFMDANYKVVVQWRLDGEYLRLRMTWSQALRWVLWAKWRRLTFRSLNPVYVPPGTVVESGAL